MNFPSLGELMANLMAIEFPESGHLNDEPIAPSAGGAPHLNESERCRGKAFIRGGRPRERTKLSMAAFDARLAAWGKTFEQSLTACMRERLELMNVLVSRAQL